MVTINKNILRSILILSYVFIITLIVYGISAIFSYLNTGADRSKMLHVEIRKIEQYIPKINWAELNNKGRPMDLQTLANVQKDFQDAWYIKCISLKKNSTNGIDDYFTENARKNLYEIIAINDSTNVTLESTSLTHNLTLDFFSEDGQMIAITDNDAIEYKRIYKNNTLALETKEKSTYKIILLLEDGFWRIRHLVKETTEDYTPENPLLTTEDLNIKGINYYPQETPWNVFGDHFDSKIIAKDFDIIKNAGLNSIRIFVPYVAFGKAKVDDKKLQQLVKVLDLAEASELKVMVTLFDFYGDYSVLDWTLNQRHAETIVTALKDHTALFAWDIKNEPNLDFESRGEAKVLAWLENMIDLVKSIDSKTPITVGWSDAESATHLKKQLDFISFHYYKKLEDLGTTYDALKSEIKDKPIVITEFGLSSYKGFWNPFGTSEEDQANYHKEAQAIFAKHDIMAMSWTLYDFTEIPKEVVGRLPWRKNAQKHFGFINKDGVKKASFEYIVN